MRKKVLCYMICLVFWAALIFSLIYRMSLTKKSLETEMAKRNYFSGETVYVGNVENKYHKDNCRYAKELVKSMPEEKAKYFGFSPCSKCIK